MSVLWAKVRADLRLRPARALLLALTVLLSSMAITGALTARGTLTKAVRASFAGALPPALIVQVDGDARLALALIEADTSVAAAELRRIVRGRVAVGPKGTGGWASFRLTLLPSMASQSVSRIEAPLDADLSGALVERSGMPIWAEPPGTPLRIRLPGGIEARLPTSGVAMDGAVAPGVQDRIVYAYAGPEAAAAAGLPATFDEVHARFEDGTDAGPAIDCIVATLREAGIEPLRIERVLQRHPHADQMQAVLALLVVFAIAALMTAAALVANAVTAALRAETRIIGVQKALGASAGRVIGEVALSTVLVAAPAALLGAVAGAAASSAFVTWAGHELNLMSMPGPSIRLAILGAMIGMATPVAVAALVAWRAAEVPPLDAIHPERGGADATAGGTLRTGSAVWSWALRHLVGRPLRMALVLLALTLGGTALMVAANVYRSLDAAVARAFDARTDDLDLRLLAPVPAADLLRAATVPGVVRTEAWGGGLVSVADGGGGQTGTRFGLLAPSPGTELLDLPVAEGRWPGDPSAMEVVVGRNLLAKEPSLALGATVVLAHGPGRAAATVVGLTEEASEPGLYATPGLWDALAGRPGQAGALRLTVGDGTHPGAVLAALEDRLFAAGAVPALAFDRAELITATTGHFAILLVLLGTVAGVALIVGGLGLASSVALSLVERTREIGLLRAIGATDAAIRRLVLGESLLIVLVAFVLASLLASPLSAMIARGIGEGMLHLGVPLRLSWTGIALWAGAALGLGLIATLLPLKQSLRLPPARALSYE